MGMNRYAEIGQEYKAESAVMIVLSCLVVEHAECDFVNPESDFLNLPCWVLR